MANLSMSEESFNEYIKCYDLEGIFYKFFYCFYDIKIDNIPISDHRNAFLVYLISEYELFYFIFSLTCESELEYFHIKEKTLEFLSLFSNDFNQDKVKEQLNSVEVVQLYKILTGFTYG